MGAALVRVRVRVRVWVRARARGRGRARARARAGPKPDLLVGLGRRDGEEAVVDELLRHRVVGLEHGALRVCKVEAAVHRGGVDRLAHAAADRDARGEVLS